VSSEQGRPGARGSGNGQAGLVLARAPGIPDWKKFSAEDLRQLVMAAELGAIHHGDQLTRDRWRMLGRRLRQAAEALQEGQEPEQDYRCYACGRPV
jgi:hypothetical protein